MDRLSAREVKRRLKAARQTPPPPADLLGRLRSEIPSAALAAGAGAGPGPRAATGEARTSLPRTRWLAAAALATVAVGLFALRLMDQPPASEPQPRRDVGRPDAAAPAGAVAPGPQTERGDAGIFSPRPSPPSRAELQGSSPGAAAGEEAATPPPADSASLLRSTGELPSAARKSPARPSPSQVAAQPPPAFEGGLASRSAPAPEASPSPPPSPVQPGVPESIMVEPTPAAPSATTTAVADGMEEPARAKRRGFETGEPGAGFEPEPSAAVYRAVRSALDSGQLPPRGLVQPQDLVGAFGYGDPLPVEAAAKAALPPVPPEATAPGNRPGEAKQAAGLVLLAEGAVLSSAGDPATRLVRLHLSASAAALPVELWCRFDPRVVTRYRLAGAARWLPASLPVHSLLETKGEAGAGMTQLYEVELRPVWSGKEGRSVADRGSGGRLEAGDGEADAIVRASARPRGGARDLVSVLTPGALARRWEDATPGLRLAWIVVELGKVLRDGPTPGGRRLPSLLQQVREIVPTLPASSGAAEVERLLAEAVRIEAQSTKR